MNVQGLYICKDIQNLIYRYADEAVHKDHMELIISEFYDCIQSYNNIEYSSYTRSHQTNLKYIYIEKLTSVFESTVDKLTFAYPKHTTVDTNSDSEFRMYERSVCEHKSIVKRIKGMFYGIRYYKYRQKGGTYHFIRWKNELQY